MSHIRNNSNPSNNSSKSRLDVADLENGQPEGKSEEQEGSGSHALQLCCRHDHHSPSLDALTEPSYYAQVEKEKKEVKEKKKTKKKQDGKEVKVKKEKFETRVADRSCPRGAGQQISLFASHSSGWSTGMLQGQVGMFPRRELFSERAVKEPSRASSSWPSLRPTLQPPYVLHRRHAIEHIIARAPRRGWRLASASSHKLNLCAN